MPISAVNVGTRDLWISDVMFVGSTEVNSNLVDEMYVGDTRGFQIFWAGFFPVTPRTDRGYSYRIKPDTRTFLVSDERTFKA